MIKKPQFLRSGATHWPKEESGGAVRCLQDVCWCNSRGMEKAGGEFPETLRVLGGEAGKDRL